MLVTVDGGNEITYLYPLQVVQLRGDQAMREAKSLMQKWSMDFRSLCLNLAHQPQGIMVKKGEVFVALVQRVLA